jgi:hypothetical protein
MDQVIDSLYKIVTNRFLLVPLGAMLFAQFLKFVYYGIKDRTMDFAILFSTGRMPSSHSAFVCCLTTLLGIHIGFDSAIFATALVFSFIIMYDATGIRHQAGKQAQLLNQIVDEIFHKQPVNTGHLKEFLGHTPFEVYVGGIVGVIIAIIFH